MNNANKRANEFSEKVLAVINPIWPYLVIVLAVCSALLVLTWDNWFYGVVGVIGLAYSLYYGVMVLIEWRTGRKLRKL